MPTVARVVRTCSACPTQYDVHLTDGRYAYFRYRHGRLSFELFPDDSQEAFYGEPLAYVLEDLSEEDPDGGVMDHEEAIRWMARLLPELLEGTKRGGPTYRSGVGQPRDDSGAGARAPGG